MRGLSCYNNPNRLTGKAQAVTWGEGGLQPVGGKYGPIGGFSKAVGGGASSLCCSLTSGEGKSPRGMSR